MKNDSLFHTNSRKVAWIIEQTKKNLNWGLNQAIFETLHSSIVKVWCPVLPCWLIRYLNLTGDDYLFHKISRYFEHDSRVRPTCRNSSHFYAVPTMTGPEFLRNPIPNKNREKIRIKNPKASIRQCRGMNNRFRPDKHQAQRQDLE